MSLFITDLEFSLSVELTCVGPCEVCGIVST